MARLVGTVWASWRRDLVQGLPGERGGGGAGEGDLRLLAGGGEGLLLLLLLNKKAEFSSVSDIYN